MYIIHIISLCLLHGCLRRRSLPAPLLLYKTPNPCYNKRDNLSNQPHCPGTHRTPNLHANRPHGRPGERQYPLNVVWKPTRREREDGAAVVAELEEELEAAGADPPGDFDGPVERGFLGVEVFVLLTLASFTSLGRMKEKRAMHTCGLILLQRLIVSSSQFRPFRKFILRAGIVHVPFQLEDLAS